MSAFGLEAHGFRNLKAGELESDRPGPLRGSRPPRRRPCRQGWPAGRSDRPAHRPLRLRQIRRASDANTEPNVWWDNNKAMSPAHFDALHADMMAYRRRPGIVRQGSVRRRRSHPSHHGAHRHRICLALAVRASAPDPPDGGTAERLRSGIHHHRPAQLQRRSRQAWLRQPDGDRGQFHQEDDPDRRHLLCRRDEEVGLHHHELPAAAPSG